MMNFLKYTLLAVCIFVLCFILFNAFIPIYLNGIISFGITVIIVFFIPKETIKKSGINQFYFVSIFLLLIFTPFVGEKENESLEKRKLKEFPEWRWSNVWKFFKGYQSYFNDRFAYRNSIIDFYGKLKYEKIGFTNMTGDIAFGKDNWLFYHEKDYLDRIAKPFTEKELQTLHYNLVVTTTWFNQHGIKYYLIIPPMKPRIYFDKIPNYMKISTDFSRLEQFNSYLNKNSKIQLIDVRSELIEEKKSHQVYYKTDTHWNQRGAFVAYTKIINTLNLDFPELQPIKISEMKQTSMEFLGDLMPFLGHKSAIETTESLFEPKDTTLKPQLVRSVIPPDDSSHRLEVWETTKSLSNLKIYVVRDSFSENLKKFLSLNFSTSIYAWTTDVPIVEAIEEKPDIVLHEIVERFAFFYLELPLEIKNDTAFTNQFNIEDF